MNTATTVLPTLPYRFETALTYPSGIVYNLPDQRILICELTAEYIPLKEFKEIFTSIVPLVKEHSTEKFIFDKQHLRVFHQPSMEWYFIYWKRELLENGLARHRKILPQQNPAFSLAVEAGRDKIMKEYGDKVVSGLDIQYKKTIHEAIES